MNELTVNAHFERGKLFRWMMYTTGSYHQFYIIIE